MRSYRVGTFYQEDIVGKVICYLRDYSTTWEGCVEYQVEASNGKEAKKKAAKLRRDEHKCKRCGNTAPQLYCGGYCQSCLEKIGPDVMDCDLDTD